MAYSCHDMIHDLELVFLGEPNRPTDAGVQMVVFGQRAGDDAKFDVSL